MDDDEVFRTELAELLGDDGHTVAVAPSAGKALAALEEDEYDLVLTDLKMPRQSGIELLREVRARWPRTLVVLLTGYATIETALEAMKAGAFDYLRKPFRADQLRATLELVAQERAFESPAGASRDPLREASALAASGGHDVLVIGDAPQGPRKGISFQPLVPDAPSQAVDQVREFLRQHPNGAVVVGGAERWLAHHRLEEVVGVLDALRAELEGHGPLRVGFDPTKVDRSAAVALGSAVAPDDTHATLEALANPIRRKVLERLGSAPATFGEAMAAAGIDDSPKMAFHLRKLVDAGLVVHTGESYRLSARGSAGLRLLVDATFLPPTGTAGNLAFPRSPDGEADERPRRNPRAPGN